MSRVTMVTVSGSFHRHMDAIQAAVAEVKFRGGRVLSPCEPDIVDSFGDFLFVASDQFRAIRAIQDRHLAAIAHSDFLWLVTPDGYVGQSASMEIGYAVARGVPVHSDSVPIDLTIRKYVQTVSGLRHTLDRYDRRPKRRNSIDSSMLLDPEGATDRMHERIEQTRRELLKPSDPYDDSSALRAIHDAHCLAVEQSDRLLEDL